MISPLPLHWSQIWSLAITQAIQLTLLIVVVFALTKIIGNRRPHLSHALWGLVLLKCLTPPIIASPSSLFSWMVNSAEQQTRLMSTESSTSSQPITAKWTIKDQIEYKDLYRLHPLKTVEKVDNRFQEEIDKTDQRQAKSPVNRVVDLVKDPSRTAPSSRPTAATFLTTPPAHSIFYVWICGGFVFLTVVLLRLSTFLARVRRCRVTPETSTQEIFNELRDAIIGNRSGIFVRKIQLMIVDRAIGPAVVGLFRPKILIPKFLEKECSNDELRMLLAHEMIHVRRGDLWWSTLQALSRCVWWFHPLMYIVGRCFDRATELSCDEETVASLRCSPSLYARSLLSVLERKHQFKVAPLLPGVRPVELTSKRMERIMKLSEKALPKKPWWAVFVLLVGGIVVLPGAAWSLADEQPKTNRDDSAQATKGKPSDTLSQLPSAQPIIPPPQAFPSRYGSELKPSSDIDYTGVSEHSSLPTIGCISRELGCSHERAATLLSTRLDSISPPQCKAIVGPGRIIAQGPKSYHQLINRELDRIQKHGFSKAIKIDLKFTTVSKEMFESLAVHWQLVQAEPGQSPVVMALLEDQQVKKVIDELQNDARTNILHAPKLKVFNGQSAMIADFVERPFMVAPSTVRVEKDGMECGVIATIINERAIKLDIKFEYNVVRDVREFAFKTAEDKGVKLQIPDTSKNVIDVSINVPADGHLAFAMPASNEKDQVLLHIVSPRIDGEETINIASSPSVSLNSGTKEVLPDPIHQVNHLALPAIPDTNESLDSMIILKADGPKMDSEKIAKISALFNALDLPVRIAGSWEIEEGENGTSLTGKNILMSSIDSGLMIECESGVLTIEPAKREVLVRAAGEDVSVNAAIEDFTLLHCKRILLSETHLEVVGAPVSFEYRMEEAIEPLRGQVERISYGFEKGGHSFAGEFRASLNLIDMEASKAILSETHPRKLSLSGDVQVVRKADDAASQDRPFQIQGSEAVIDLESMAVEAKN